MLQPTEDKLWPHTQDPTWVVEQEGFDPSREREIESLFSIGNGYLGVRGASDFTLPTSQADLFIAGVYDQKIAPPPYSEVELISDPRRLNPFTELVPFPSPFPIKVWVQGKILSLRDSALKSHSRRLDLAQGIYFETFRFEDEKGRITNIRTMRLASLLNRHLLFQEIELGCENHSSEITMEFAPLESLEVYPNLRRQEDIHSSKLAKRRHYETRVSKIFCSVGHRIWRDASDVSNSNLQFHATLGRLSRIRHAISVFTSKDSESPANESTQLLLTASWNQLRLHLKNHTSVWQSFWHSQDIHIDDRPELLQAQRFNCYHLRITADHDSKVSIGARALTGRAYEGHIFWDTEIFMFPFYLYTEPEIAKHLLLYRYHTLKGAKQRAAALGHSGACYAWESTVTGEDVTPQRIVIKGSGQEIPIFTGTQQLHVTADISFAIWNYWNVTLDSKFLAEYGVEILIETARFWTSRLEPENGLFRLRSVIGPDEYHQNIDDNAYTNWMVRFNLEKAVWGMSWIQLYDPDKAQELRQRLKVSNEEIGTWKVTAQKVHQPRINSQGVIEQFDGFFDLQEVSIPTENHLKMPMSRLLDWQKVKQLQIIKQADVLMVPFLFPNSFSRSTLLANYQYYEPKTDHGSSLSPCVHAAIAAQSGLKEHAKHYWEKGLNFDLVNAMKNTALGIHSGCMGGTWQALIFHMLGINVSENGITLRQSEPPVLPTGCRRIQFKIYFRGKRHTLKILPDGRIAA